MQKQTRRRRPTRTSSFGTNGRISHDASTFYARALYLDSAALEIKPEPDQIIPTDRLDRIFRHTSEDMRELPDRSVHLMVTSPPYNVGKDYDDDLTIDEYRLLLKRVMEETYRVLVDGGRACVNIANLGRRPYIPIHSYVIEDAHDAGFFMRGEIIWNKADVAGNSTAWGSWRSPSNPILRDTHEYILVFQKPPFKRIAPKKRRATISPEDFLEFTSSVWAFPPESAKRAGHPAPFPVELPKRLIKLYTFSDEVVLDPFMGTGATALAAVEAGRRFVGFETFDEYAERATRRIEEWRSEFDYPFNRPGSTSYQTQLVEEPTLLTNPQEAQLELVRIIDEHEFKNGIDNQSLRRYFEKAFHEVMAKHDLYPAWACINCLRQGDSTVNWGVKPVTCPECGDTATYSIATFQGRASRFGDIFVVALQHLLQTHYGLELKHTPRSIRTHNLEVTPKVAVDAKGSAREIIFPNQVIHRNPRAGMMRSDTIKKTSDNARNFMNSNPDGTFFIATNALPLRLMGHRSDIITGIFDVTKKDQLDAFVHEVRAASQH